MSVVADTSMISLEITGSAGPLRIEVLCAMIHGAYD